MEKKISRTMTEDALKEALERWTKLLFLRDWSIKVQFVDQDKMRELSGDETTLGFNQSDQALKCAIISLLKWEERPRRDDLWFDYCQEYTLIHELLHCKLPYYEASPDSVDRHRAYDAHHFELDSIARALFCAYYHVEPGELVNLG